MRKLENRFLKANKGAVMLEVIVAMALIILITPMIYTRVSEYTQEIEDGAAASKLRLIKQGMSSYIEANYEKILNGTIPIKQTEAGTAATIPPLAEDAEFDSFTIAVTDDEVQKFLRPEYYTGFKMFDGISIAIKRKRIGENIVVNAIIATQTNAGKNPISEGRGIRIAGLVGSDAGYVKKKNNEAEYKARGAGGYVELDMAEYFKTDASTTNNQIAVSTGFFPADMRVSTQEVVYDFLFRKKYELGSYPPNYDPEKAHRMETYIDFGIEDVDAEIVDGHNVEEVGKIYGKEYKLSTTEDLTDFTYKTQPDADGNQEEIITYGVDFETNTAFLEDFKVASLGGAKVTEILPNLILMAVYENITFGSYVPRPGFDNPKVVKKDAGCPTGFTERYELVQKEMLKSVDTLALAEHSAPYNTGINSVRSWLRNNKLLRSTFKINDDQYYRIYGNNAEIIGECIGSDESDIQCATLEYKDNLPKLSEYCTINKTVIYNVNDPNNNVDFNLAFPFIEEHDKLQKWGEYDKNIGTVAIHSDPAQDPIVTISAGGTLTCKNKNYCPGYNANESVSLGSNNQYASELMQHGSCQAALNTFLNGNFLPYGDDGWIEVRSDGSPGQTNVTINETLTYDTNANPSEGVNYITRVFHKIQTLSLDADCPNADTLISNKIGLCYNSENNRRYTHLPIKYDLYFYCEKQ